MKAIRAHEWCEPQGLRLDEVPIPEPREGEALVKVGAASLNFPDMLMIKGTYQVKPDLPFIPGMEVSGTIEKLGPGVNGFRIGDRIASWTGRGAFAEYAVVQPSALHAVPKGMTDEEAAGFPLVYQTSYFGIAYRGQMRKGETVLVHSAAGGVGLAAVQIARGLGAGKIIATVGSDEKKELVLKHGADLVINYEKEDFVEIVKRETKDLGADVIYDPVGGEIGERNTKCVAFDGRIVIVGFTSGKFSKFMSNHILVKNYSVVGLHWGNYRKFKPEMVEQGWRELMKLYDAGSLRPVIAAVYPMEKVADAMGFLASRKAVGKIVLKWTLEKEKE